MYVQLRSQRPLPKRKEMPVILFYKVVDKKRTLGKRGPRRRKGTRGR
jgi:hypothetical protein